MGLLTNIHDFLSRKECPYTQFAKYVLCGGIAVFVDMSVFYLLGWLAFPCLQVDDPVYRLLQALGFSVQQVAPDRLIRNYWIVKVFCFAASNATVYLLNVLYVFEGGKHRRHHEVLLFFLVTLVVFLSGTWLGAWLISTMGWNTTYAYVFVLAVGVVGNYTMRKFVVFKR